MDFIDLKTPYKLLEQSIQRRMNAVLERGSYIMGPEVTELEGALARYTGAGDCIACASGTDALLMAMMALGIGAGDEVVTTPFTFIATGETIALLGARPVFVDIDPRSYNIDPELIEAAITPRTRAIMPVSLYGQCADFDAINAIAARHRLPVIEDAAQSFGATYKGRHSCALSTIACTSFYPAKPLGCYGDGGACFTDDPELAQRLRCIRDHGQEGRYHHTRIGVNGRLDSLQAAILLAKMELFPGEVQARSRIGARYTELLAGSVGVPHVESHNTSVYAQYTVRVPRREAFQAALREQGVPTAVHYPTPLHLQPAFAYLRVPRGALPVAERAAAEVVSLPMHPYLEEAAVGSVARAVRQAVGASASAVV